MKHEQDRSSEVVRFRFNEKGVRPAHNGDPVVNKRGHTIGVVTSCALNSEGLLTGQAYIELKYNKPGTTILIFQSAPNKSSKAPAKLIPGDKVAIPTPASVIPRFFRK